MIPGIDFEYYKNKSNWLVSSKTTLTNRLKIIRLLIY